MDPVHRQNHHHREIRQHDGQIERIRLVQPAKGGVDQLVPVMRERAARSGGSKKTAFAADVKVCLLPVNLLKMRASQPTKSLIIQAAHFLRKHYLPRAWRPQ